MKILPSTNSRFYLLVAAVAASVLFTLHSSVAALIITDSDIVNGEYVYSYGYTQAHAALNSSTPPANTTVSTDISSSTNMRLYQESSTFYYLRATPGTTATTASFVYTFDFSDTDFRPISLSLYDYVAAYTNVTNQGSVVTEWSIDGTNWTTIRSVSNVGASSNQFSFGTTTIDLSSQPDVVYYRTTFTAVSGNLNTSSFRWGRFTSSSSDLPFSADFDMVAVPEPRTMTMLIVGMGSVIFFRRRKGTV